MKNLNRVDWLLFSGLLAMCIIPAGGGIVRLVALASGAEITAEHARFFAAPAPVVLHILASLTFCAGGVFQIAPGFRTRHRKGHRRTGRVLVPLGILAAASGLWMTIFYSIPDQDWLLFVARMVFGLAMGVSISIGLWAVAQRNFIAHEAWMLRGYAIGMGAGTQALVFMPLALTMSMPEPGALRSGLMTMAWMINVAIVEIYLARRHGTVGGELNRVRQPAR